MKLQELIELLTEQLERFEEAGVGDVEVLLATQPSWPLAFNVGGVWNPADEECECPECGSVDPMYKRNDCTNEWHDETEELEPVVWISAGGHPYNRSPYAPKAAFGG